MGIQAQECVAVPSEKFWLRVTVHQRHFLPNVAHHRSLHLQACPLLPLNCHWTSRHKLDKHALKETREWQMEMQEKEIPRFWNSDRT